MGAEKQACMIIGAAPIDGRRIFKEFDPRHYYVICADGGYESALKAGVQPDLIVGDFDSAKEPPSEKIKCLTLPVEKDVTDTMYAVLKGFSMGFRSFLLLGCLGGERFDHNLANLEVLQYIREHGGHGIIADKSTKIFLLHDERLKMTGMKGATISVFPYNGSACTVSYYGLKYPLNREQLSCGGFPMGISNEVSEDPAEVRVHNGSALVVVSQ